MQQGRVRVKDFGGPELEATLDQLRFRINMWYRQFYYWPTPVQSIFTLEALA